MCHSLPAIARSRRAPGRSDRAEVRNFYSALAPRPAGRKRIKWSGITVIPYRHGAVNDALDSDDRGAAINGLGDHATLLDGLAILGKGLKRAGIARPAKPKTPLPVPPMVALWEDREESRA